MTNHKLNVLGGTVTLGGDVVRAENSLTKTTMITEPLLITPEQAESLERVIARQGPENLEAIALDYGSDPTLFVKFTHILIGIEPDGYAHS
jgi:hypothetical protein